MGVADGTRTCSCTTSALPAECQAAQGTLLDAEMMLTRIAEEELSMFAAFSEAEIETFKKVLKGLIARS